MDACIGINSGKGLFTIFNIDRDFHTGGIRANCIHWFNINGLCIKKFYGERLRCVTFIRVIDHHLVVGSRQQSAPAFPDSHDGIIDEPVHSIGGFSALNGSLQINRLPITGGKGTVETGLNRIINSDDNRIKNVDPTRIGHQQCPLECIGSRLRHCNIGTIVISVFNLHIGIGGAIRAVQECPTARPCIFLTRSDRHQSEHIGTIFTVGAGRSHIFAINRNNHYLLLLAVFTTILIRHCQRNSYHPCFIPDFFKYIQAVIIIFPFLKSCMVLIIIDSKRNHHVIHTGVQIKWHRISSTRANGFFFIYANSNQRCFKHFNPNGINIQVAGAINQYFI